MFIYLLSIIYLNMIFYIHVVYYVASQHMIFLYLEIKPQMPIKV